MKLNHQFEKYSENINRSDIICDVPKIIAVLICKQSSLSEKMFVGEKFSHFWKISHFSPSNFSDSSLFPDQFLKLKGLSWVGLLFFQRKVVLLVSDFSNWAWRSALLVSLIHGIGCRKYTPSWISQNKKILYNLIFRDHKIFGRIPEEF